MKSPQVKKTASKKNKNDPQPTSMLGALINLNVAQIAKIRAMIKQT